MDNKEITFNIKRPSKDIFIHMRTNGELYKIHIDDDRGGTIVLELSGDEFKDICVSMEKLLGDVCGS